MKLELDKVYKDSKGKEWKIVCDTEHHPQNMLAIDRKKQNHQWYYPDGKRFGPEYYSDQDLIELVGDDFTPIKVPREFKFEAWIGECSCAGPQGIYPISTALGMFCTGPYVNRDMIEETKNQKASKWEFTIKELLEEQDGV